jgi:hypothetical protein
MVALKLGVGGTPPEGEGTVGVFDHLAPRGPADCRASRRGQGIEDLSVVLVAAQVEPVARIGSDDHVVADERTQLREVGVEGGASRPGHLIGPVAVDQLIGGEGACRLQEQDREQTPKGGPPEWDLGSGSDPQGSKDVEPHGLSSDAHRNLASV